MSKEKEKIDITHLSHDVLVRLLQSSGCRDYNSELLQADIALGAPVNEDGTINLFDYAAWLYDERYIKRGV